MLSEARARESDATDQRFASYILQQRLVLGGRAEESCFR
jgi:hypothetical protein